MLDISIIIPIYNVEKYLKECLDSVKKVAEKLCVEVIMIDDGSTDGSGLIAQEYAEKYQAFSYYYQENSGQGKARNYGVTLAKGKYLWFVDSDDIVNANVFYRMFCMAEQNKTDLVVCDAARIKNKEVTAAEQFLYVFHNLVEPATHITEHFAFVYDTMVWNKLILRSFYEKYEFAFPEGYMYEDVPWAIEVHYYANRVSVLNEVGYYWRIRTGENKSTTQKKNEKKNLTDKIEMFQRAFDFIDQTVKNKELHMMMEVRQWGFDYVGYLNLLSEMKREAAMEYVEILAEYIEKNMTSEGYESLTLIHQQIVHDILKRDLEHLLRVNNYRKINYQNAPIVEKVNGMELLVSGEIFTIQNRSARNEFRFKPARCQIDHMQLKDGELALEGHVYYRKINIPEGRQSYEAVLCETVSLKRKEISIQPMKCEWLTVEQGTVINHDDYKTYYYNYDGTGFRIIINLIDLEKEARAGEVYKIMLMQKNDVISTARVLRGIKKPEVLVYDGNKIRIEVSTDRRDTIQMLILEKEVPVKETKETWWKRLVK